MFWVPWTIFRYHVHTGNSWFSTPVEAAENDLFPSDFTAVNKLKIPAQTATTNCSWDARAG